jgi:putative polyketide hydroxylase
MNSDASVGIIGGGPCGLMTALLLARAGIRCVVFEKKPGISAHPKAMGISRRTSELYRQLGLLEAIENGSLADNGRFLSIWAKSLVGEELGRVQYSAVPNELTPCTGLHCPQTWTERVLLDAVTAEPLAEVKFNCEILSILPQRDFVRLSLPAGGTLDVPWLVAADGAGSAIRRQLGVETDGPGDMGHFLNVMFRAKYGSYLRDRPAILYPTLSNEYFEFFVAINGDDLWLIHHFLQPGEQPSHFPEERLLGLIREASGLPAEPVELLSIMPWVMSPKVARQYRVGRVFLVGDAAARLSPAGGLGLNTGLQSAHNLAWKLACVISGRAGDTLLDTYQEERHDAAIWTMQNTNRNAGEIFDVVSNAMANDWVKVRELIAQSRRGGAGLGQDLGVAYSRGAFLADGSEAPIVNDPINEYKPSARPGSRAPHLWIKCQRARLSTLDLFGKTFVLLAGRENQAIPLPTGFAIVLKNGIDFAAHGFEELYGITPSGAVLVRPDGYVGARWPQLFKDSRAQVESAFTAILRNGQL